MKTRIIYSDHYSQDDFDKTYALCEKHAENPNYEVKDWEKKPHTFMYLFFKEKRFSKQNGGLVFLEDGEALCGISGFSKSHFHPDIYILGVRTLVDQKYRHQLLVSIYLIPEQIAQLRGKAKMAIFTFDQSNTSNIYELYLKGKLNLFLKNKLSHFPAWAQLEHLSFPVTINFTKQNILFIKIDKNFEFDWESLRGD